MMEDGVARPQGFNDEGYSRDNLVRPGLDHIRDLATQGELKQLYIQCPDRLASGAKLMFFGSSAISLQGCPARLWTS